MTFSHFIYDGPQNFTLIGYSLTIYFLISGILLTFTIVLKGLGRIIKDLHIISQLFTSLSI